MPGLKIMCPICTDDFVEADEIYSTICGHIYHFSCMRQWQSRATSCPQCRTHNPETHKVYLILNDATAEETPTAPSTDDEDIKVKLESSVDKIRELQAQVEECETNFYLLQEQYTVEQELRKKLEHTIAQYIDNETDFLQLHAQYSESEHQMKLLQEENERLTIENDYKDEELAIKDSKLSAVNEILGTSNTEQFETGECRILDFQALYMESEDRLHSLQLENKRLAIENEYKAKELALNTKEISTLKELCSVTNNEKSDLFHKTKFDTLEQKCKHVNGELEKEIANSTQLAIDKIKLQSCIQRMEFQAKDNAITATVKSETVTHPQRRSLENTTNVPLELSSQTKHIIQKT